MASVSAFPEGQVEALARLLGECGSGTDISRVLADRGLADASGESTKWRRLYWIFLESQRAHGCANRVIDFICAFLTPARFVGRNDEFESRRQELNAILAFSGLAYGSDGQFRHVPAATTLTIGAIAGVAKYDVRLLAEGIAPVDLSIRCHVSRSTTVSPSAIDLGPVAAASTHHRRIVVSTRKSERNALLATEGIETLRAVLSAPDTHNRVCFDVSLVAPLTPGPFSGSVSVRLLDTKEALTLPVRGTVLPALMLSPSYLVFDGSAERQIDIGTPSGHPANAPPSVLGLPTGLRSRTEHVPPKNWRMYFECDASAEPGAYECTVVLGQHEARLYLEIL